MEGPLVKIGLISDTHIPSMGPEPPPEVIPAFEGVDLIIHAGDVYTDDCIKWLERIAPVKATTSGFGPGVEAAPRLVIPIVVEAEGYTIGVVHKLDLIAYPNDIYPGSLARYPASKDLIAELDEVFGKRVDIVIIGYTHEAMIETHRGVLFVNPGSPTMVGQIMKLGHVAVLDLTPDTAEARIIDLNTVKA
jgi:putative phosphoesterase